MLAWEKKKVKVLKIIKKKEQLGVVAYTFNPNTWKTEEGRPL